jgi:hypothetical protein
VRGSVLANVTFVSIQWGWLAVLAGQLVVAVMFLITTMMHTSQLEVPVLKSSTLAMLFALDEKSRSTAGGIDSVKAMKEKAGLVHVRLQDGKLVLAENSTDPEVRSLRS